MLLEELLEPASVLGQSAGGLQVCVVEGQWIVLEVDDGDLRAGLARALCGRAGDEGTLRLEASDGPSGFNRVRFTFQTRPGENFLGFGEQYNRVRHAGMQVPIWTSEQGIGRGDGPLRLPFTGRTTDSYFPLPFYLSTRGYGLLADSTARTVFDLGAAPRPDRISIETWEGRGALCLFAGPRPVDVLRRSTLFMGRPRMLPEWAFGVWAAAQGGPARLRELLAKLTAAGTKIDALWAQDWLGARSRIYGYDVRYHWTADEKLYPDLGRFIGELHGQGVRFLGYFNTFIEKGFPEYGEAARRGFLVKRADGTPYLQQISTFSGGLVDLSNAGARQFLGGFLRQAMRMGMDGWMADFGEWLPYDARIEAAEGAPLWHNRYPVEWARLNRESCLAERPAGDFVVFNRSGHIGSVRYSDIIWAGDQNTGWGKADGLPSVVPAGLTLGLSGVPFWHFDAGGFTSLITLPRGEELFMRWVEAGAMSPLLRTHEGYWRQLNCQIDSNARVLSHFAAMAALHRRIQPKLVAAAREAVDTGLPIVRHLWLEHPDDPTCLGIEDEYQLGSDLLAAPVLTPRATSRRVYFPPGGTWVHWSDNLQYPGGTWATVDAPLGTPALFCRAGQGF
ncbi:MAG: hypothetical protein HY303_10245 [Candidatus Wallbacteria bacterium]|nr:hypothetical protein [Candidatus Wallbacteria bacterium]